MVEPSIITWQPAASLATALNILQIMQNTGAIYLVSGRNVCETLSSIFGFKWRRKGISEVPTVSTVRNCLLYLFGVQERSCGHVIYPLF